MTAPDTKELFKAAKSGNRECLETLVNANLRLVHSIVRRFAGRGAEQDDLFQIGSIGLIKAIYGFDTERGMAFSTYAVPMIMGEIRRYLRDDGAVRVSRRLKEISVKAKYLSEELSKKMSREPTVSELATQMGISGEELAAAIEATLPPESINRPLFDGSEALLVDSICTRSDMFDRVNSRVVLETLLKKADETSRAVLYYRYFEDKKQTDIAALLGISQVQVSRIEKRALRKMREQLNK